MARNTSLAQDIIARQERVLRLAERDYGLTLSVLEAETGIGKTTLATYKRETAMPAYALVLLSAVIPDELVSLMFEPVGKHVATNDGDEGDLDALARDSAGYNVEYLNARHPEGEGGADITPRERANLKDRARRIASIAQKAAA